MAEAGALSAKATVTYNWLIPISVTTAIRTAEIKRVIPSSVVLLFTTHNHEENKKSRQWASLGLQAPRPPLSGRQVPVPDQGEEPQASGDHAGHGSVPVIAEPFDRAGVIEPSGQLHEPVMSGPWYWEKIDNFGSLRERDCFLAWMEGQIASGISEEVKPPPDQRQEPGNRWFRYVPTGALWRLVPDDNPFGPGFWPAYEPPAERVAGRPLDRRWPPIDYR